MNNYTTNIICTTAMGFELNRVQIGKILHKAFLLSNERRKRIVHEVAPRENI